MVGAGVCGSVSTYEVVRRFRRRRLRRRVVRAARRTMAAVVAAAMVEVLLLLGLVSGAAAGVDVGGDGAEVLAVEAVSGGTSAVKALTMLRMP
jgi:hypothetical protein